MRTGGSRDDRRYVLVMWPHLNNIVSFTLKTVRSWWIVWILAAFQELWLNMLCGKILLSAVEWAANSNESFSALFLPFAKWSFFWLQSLTSSLCWKWLVVLIWSLWSKSVKMLSTERLVYCVPLFFYLNYLVTVFISRGTLDFKTWKNGLSSVFISFHYQCHLYGKQSFQLYKEQIRWIIHSSLCGVQKQALDLTAFLEDVPLFNIYLMLRFSRCVGLCLKVWESNTKNLQSLCEFCVKFWG